jgi:hypothetical protein
MSCSGEVVEKEPELIQIRPSIVKQLKKAKYGVADHSTVGLCHWTKKSFRGEGTCYKHKFYGIRWNFLLLECIVRIDVYTAGVQWNFMIPWKCNRKMLLNQKIL